ncbi:hypothetical protein ACWDOP_36510 [Nocardia sp. NPDC003693]
MRALDQINRFETKQTYAVIRAEWLTGFAVATVLAVLHYHEIRWPVFIMLFLAIDVLGYLPGAIAFRRSRTGRIAKGYYVAYNISHSLVTAAVVAGLWSWWFGAEWALLALPIHLFGDRALFGNSIKPFGVPFEPAPMAAFTEFEEKYRRTVGGRDAGDSNA